MRTPSTTLPVLRINLMPLTLTLYVAASLERTWTCNVSVKSLMSPATTISNSTTDLYSPPESESDGEGEGEGEG